MTLTGYWKSDYTQAIQDCRVYDMPNLPGTPRGILTVKDTEAFAFVKE